MSRRMRAVAQSAMDVFVVFVAVVAVTLVLGALPLMLDDITQTQEEQDVADDLQAAIDQAKAAHLGSQGVQQISSPTASPLAP